MYLNIQLFEPYAELHYIARRLKYHKLITNYRLDENGQTHIALTTNTLSFKFYGLEQLVTLGVNIPEQLRTEVDFRKNQIKQNEETNFTNNNKKDLNRNII